MSNSTSSCQHEYQMLFIDRPHEMTKSLCCKCKNCGFVVHEEVLRGPLKRCVLQHEKEQEFYRVHDPIRDAEFTVIPLKELEAS